LPHPVSQAYMQWFISCCCKKNHWSKRSLVLLYSIRVNVIIAY
jgi:hypothetical protein